MRKKNRIEIKKIEIIFMYIILYIYIYSWQERASRVPVILSQRGFLIYRILFVDLSSRTSVFKPKSSTNNAFHSKTQVHELRSVIFKKHNERFTSNCLTGCPFLTRLAQSAAHAFAASISKVMRLIARDTHTDETAWIDGVSAWTARDTHRSVYGNIRHALYNWRLVCLCPPCFLNSPSLCFC